MIINSKGFQNLDSIKDKREYFTKCYLDSNNKKVLYIHIPFCVRKCNYCICPTKTCSQNDFDVNTYVYDKFTSELLKYNEIFKNVKFDQLYIGGGTPTIISSLWLDKILERIPHVDEIKVKSIECSPEFISPSHIKILKKYGFNYISMGVQSLQENFCKWQNRYFVSKDRLLELSELFKKYEIYFNYDMICYFGKGDIRDLPMFFDDMCFLVNKCKPSSICVHQLHQIEFTEEKTKCLIGTLNKIIAETKGDYECVNSDLVYKDALIETIYQAEYRLVRENREFSHYMWNRYPSIPVKYYDVLAICTDDEVNVNSNVDNLVFVENSNKIGTIKYNDFIYDDYYSLRKRKGLL